MRHGVVAEAFSRHLLGHATGSDFQTYESMEATPQKIPQQVVIVEEKVPYESGASDID